MTVIYYLWGSESPSEIDVERAVGNKRYRGHLSRKGRTSVDPSGEAEITPNPYRDDLIASVLEPYCRETRLCNGRRYGSNQRDIVAGSVLVTK